MAAAGAVSVALQGLTAERLCAVLGGDATVAEARKMMSAVHRLDHTLAPAPAQPQLEGVRNATLARVPGRVHVGRLHVAAKQASALDPFAKWVFRLADGLNVETVRRGRGTAALTGRPPKPCARRLTRRRRPRARSASRWSARGASACACPARWAAPRAAPIAPPAAWGCCARWLRGR
jgi:hypothetical protein